MAVSLTPLTDVFGSARKLTSDRFKLDHFILNIDNLLCWESTINYAWSPQKEYS
jgi:hypothetical protein